MKQIDQYSIMIASKYFDTITDHINLEKTTKEYRGNMESFSYNPIPLVKPKERQLFKNIKTFEMPYLRKGRPGHERLREFVYDEPITNLNELKDYIIQILNDKSYSLNEKEQLELRQKLFMISQLMQIKQAKIVNIRRLMNTRDDFDRDMITIVLKKNIKVNIEGNINTDQYETFEGMKEGILMNCFMSGVESMYLNKLIIDKGIHSLEFINCPQLIELELPQTMTYIGDLNVPQLRELCLPHSIEIKNIFNISSLTALTMNRYIPSIKNGKLNHTMIDSMNLTKYLALKTIDLPSTITYIDAETFSNCPLIEEFMKDVLKPKDQRKYFPNLAIVMTETFNNAWHMLYDPPKTIEEIREVIIPDDIPNFSLYTFGIYHHKSNQLDDLQLIYTGFNFYESITEAGFQSSPYYGADITIQNSNGERIKLKSGIACAYYDEIRNNKPTWDEFFIYVFDCMNQGIKPVLNQKMVFKLKFFNEYEFPDDYHILNIDLYQYNEMEVKTWMMYTEEEIKEILGFEETLNEEQIMGYNEYFYHKYLKTLN